VVELFLDLSRGRLGKGLGLVGGEYVLGDPVGPGSGVLLAAGPPVVVVLAVAETRIVELVAHVLNGVALGDVVPARAHRAGGTT
jgi:hypothetical protein